MTESPQQPNYDVAIIGAGPTGLAAAMTLQKAGITRVIVLDREPEAGGAPRHCGHPAFGLREFKRLEAGPAYARKMVATAREMGIDVALKNSVVALGPAGQLVIATPAGVSGLAAKRVLLATGIRETPRSALMVSGARGLGICNTGALQAMFYLKNLIPFHRPVVVGTEIVSFSALATCKKAGIQPVAMIEESRQPTLRWPIHHASRWFGVPLLLKTEIVNIVGNDRVEAVQVTDENTEVREIHCDGVLFTGRFTPESALVRMSHLDHDPHTGSPSTDQFGRCTDPAYYAAGNVVQPCSGKGSRPSVPVYYTAGNLPNPVKVAGKCWSEGQLAALNIARDLSGGLPILRP